MLHMRSIPMTRGLQGAATTALDLWDRLAASDPGLERLALAGRGTLSVFLTTLAAMLATRLAGFSIIDFASGITLSLMAPFLMREPTRRQRQRGLLILPLPAAGCRLPQQRWPRPCCKGRDRSGIPASWRSCSSVSWSIPATPA